MIQTIRVISRNAREDTKALSIYNEIKNSQIIQVRTAKVYRIEGISEKQAKILAEKLFCENINQEYSLNSPVIKGNYSKIEIGYKPGVMNPEVGSIIKAANDLGFEIKAADSSTEYHFSGKGKFNAVEIIEKLKIYNKLIEAIIKNPPKTLRIIGSVGKTTTIPIRKMAENELMELSRDKLFLNLEEMKVIQNHFIKIKRDPTDCEIETLAQTWSEHSGHKTFKAQLVVGGRVKEPLIKRIQKEALKHKKNIISAFVDNSGVIDFYDGWAICGKAETHNSPSAIEPYGGAMTGSGGVFRDVVATGQGAKTLFSTDIFCLANPDMPNDLLPSGCLPPKYMLKRVVAAVRDYGNRMGIPTNNGSFHFHDDFRAKPTVLVGAYGILPKNRAKIGKALVGDIVISMGGRVGRDGIHGATFSSGEMTERTIFVNSQAVQIGNAIEEKRMFDAIIEAREKNLIRVVQDSGGGGLSSAIGEIGAEIGVRIQLKNERLKYPGLSPWEIWLSESQERMVIAIPKNKLKEFKKVCSKYNVEFSELGKFTGKKKLEVYYGSEVVCNLDMNFLHKGLPQRKMTAKIPSSNSKKADSLLIKKAEDWGRIFKKVLANGNINSKEPIVRFYDHTVQGTNVVQQYSGLKNDGPNDAAVIRPLLDKSYGMIVSHGLNPVLNNTDPYWGSIWAGVEALSNYVAVGGDPSESALINNYIWPFPDEESLGSLDASVDAVVTLMKTFRIPVVSGKDSLSSTYKGKNNIVIKIPPVLCISVFGKINNVSKTQTADFKKTDSYVYLVGNQDLAAMGGSVLFSELNKEGGNIPHCDLRNLPSVFKAIRRGIRENLILSCHDISEGGLITSVFEMCVGGDVGVEIKVPKDKNAEKFLFNETAGCFIVEVEKRQTAEYLFHGLPYKILGKTAAGKRITVLQGNKNVFSEDLEGLKKVWQLPMKKIFK